MLLIFLFRPRASWHNNYILLSPPHKHLSACVHPRKLLQIQIKCGQASKGQSCLLLLTLLPKLQPSDKRKIRTHQCEKPSVWSLELSYDLLGSEGLGSPTSSARHPHTEPVSQLNLAALLTASVLGGCFSVLASPRYWGPHWNWDWLHFHQLFLVDFSGTPTLPLVLNLRVPLQPFFTPGVSIVSAPPSMASWPLCRDSQPATWCQASAVLHDRFMPSKLVLCETYLLSGMAWNTALAPSGAQLLCADTERLPRRFHLTDASLLLVTADSSVPANPHPLSQWTKGLAFTNF